MRAGLPIFAVLVASTSAAPRNLRHQHLHAHDKRAGGEVVEVVTEIAWVTVTSPGNPPAAYTPQTTPDVEPAQAPAQTPASAPAYQPAGYSPPAYSSSVSSANTPGGYIGPSSTPEQQPSPATQAPTSTTSASSQPTDSGSSSGTIPSGRGVTYTPYNDDGTIKTQDEVTSDLASIDGYSFVRIYDTNNNQVSMLINAAKPKGMKVFVGFTDPTQVTAQTQAIIDDAKDDWDTIHTVAVGNEAVFNKLTDVNGAVTALNTARSMLRKAGYQGPVVTVENNAMLMQSSNSDLCKNSDYTAANIHPWFDQNTPSSEAGSFVSNQVQQIAANCGTDSSKVVVTETGWPWQGSAHGNGNRMVASPSDQDTAISSLQSNFSDNIIFLSAFDELWKAPGEYNCEHYWGILRHNT